MIGRLQPGLIFTPLFTRVRCDVDEASLWPRWGVLTHSVGLRVAEWDSAQEDKRTGRKSKPPVLSRPTS